METKDSFRPPRPLAAGFVTPLAAGILALGVMAPAPAPAPEAQGPDQEPPGPTRRRVVPVPPMFGAVQVNEPDHDRWATSVAAAGLDSIQVTLYARQQAWDSPELFWDADAPWVVSEIRAAQRAGLRVALVMRVALEQGLPANRHLWHGMIWPRDESVEAWFGRYGEFVLQGARLAASEGVDLFAIGNELSSLTSTLPRESIPDLYAYWLDPERVAPVRAALVECADTVLRAGGGEDLVQIDGGRYADLEAMLRAEEAARRAWARRVVGADSTDPGPLGRRAARYEAAWRSLIDRVRAVYDGPVTYGANFDQVAEVGFWDALDAVGINAYFPLGRYGLGAADRDARLLDSWRSIASRLARELPDLPVLLLELGWTRKSGSTVRPYSYDRVEVLETGPSGRLTCVHWAAQPDDPAERVAAMRALATIVRDGGFPALRGFGLWKLTTRPEHRTIEPFAVVADVAVAGGHAAAGELAADARDLADAEYLRLAAEIAAMVRSHR